MATLRKTQMQMTRNLLLDAGLELFVSKGYALTTIDDIASTAGTTRVTFYAYFSSKVDLMKVLISERLNTALDRMVFDEHRSTERQLVAVVEDGSPEKIREWVAMTSERWDAIRPYTTAAMEAAAVEPELRSLLDKWWNEVVGDIREGLDRADRFPARTRHFRSVMAINELDYVARHWTEGQWGIDHDEMLDVLVECWVGLIGLH